MSEGGSAGDRNPERDARRGPRGTHLPLEDGPVFKAPWEAEAFAMTVALHERGSFTWPEWAKTLAEVIAEARARGEVDDGSDYYTHWITALERLVVRKGMFTPPLLERRKHDWIVAARRTPHGKPIEL